MAIQLYMTKTCVNSDKLKRYYDYTHNRTLNGKLHVIKNMSIKRKSAININNIHFLLLVQ